MIDITRTAIDKEKYLKEYKELNILFKCNPSHFFRKKISHFLHLRLKMRKIPKTFYYFRYFIKLYKKLYIYYDIMHPPTPVSSNVDNSISLRTERGIKYTICKEVMSMIEYVSDFLTISGFLTFLALKFFKHLNLISLLHGAKARMMNNAKRF